MTVKYEPLKEATNAYLSNFIAELDPDQLHHVIAQATEKLSQRRSFAPAYPWVFVYVLQREHKPLGRIILPHDKNKPMHEGVVLATWRPRIKMSKAGKEIEVRSELCPGDHVLFHHWAGQPVADFDEKKFRIVREADWK